VYFNGKRSLKGGMDNKMGVREPNLKKANFCLNNGGRFNFSKRCLRNYEIYSQKSEI